MNDIQCLNIFQYSLNFFKLCVFSMLKDRCKSKIYCSFMSYVMKANFKINRPLRMVSYIKVIYIYFVFRYETF